ncbi:MAG: hypothetical protein IJD45_06985 [Clostridia bacterium]|nr:hypothetical protein [Clostridia bacterium]
MAKKRFKLLNVLVLLCVFAMLVSCKPKKPEADSEGDFPKGDTSFLESVVTETDDSGIEVVKKYNFDIYCDDAVFRYENFNDAQSGKSMPYRLHLPENIKNGKKYPVILFLHGAGEIGSDNNQHLGNFSQGFSIASDLLSEAIIICPQTPEGWSIFDFENGDQNGYLAIAKRIVDSNVEKYNGDSDRIYVTGLSLGSFATWDILDAYPNYFAAAVPVCGGGGSYTSQVFIDTPIWIYHGTADPTVPYESSLTTYQAIINAGGGQNLKFTTLEGVAHNAWDYAYKDRAMFSWLFAQNRKNKKMADNYKGILEIVSADGTTVISENNIENLWGSSSGFEEYIELYFYDDADSALRQRYKKDKNQTFSLKLLGEKIYDFKLTEYPESKKIIIKKTVNDETYNEIIKLLENTLRFNQEINEF